MTYTPAWSVVFGEQPTAAKWSELGANDDALANGSAFSLNNNVIPGNALATNAITLLSLKSSTSQGSIGSSDVVITGLSGSATVPAGGRKVRVEALIPFMESSSIATNTLSIYNSLTPTASPLQEMPQLQAIAGQKISIYTFWEGTLAAGSQNFCATINTDTGSALTVLSSTLLAFLTVKVI